MTAPLPDGFTDRLAHALGPDRVLIRPADLEAYAWDNTQIRMAPQAVVLAARAEHVRRTLELCRERGVPVIPRGAGTGNVGGALAPQGGVILALAGMNRIVEINVEDRLAVVEPGVVNADLQEALKPHGLFWPPDPSSAKSCTIGGNIAMCAAGPGAIRYGVTRDWVQGLTATLSDGETIQTGGRASKSVVGYDLTRLLVGSEGTLAVVTEAILRLAPRPEAKRLLRAAFADTAAAARAVSRLMASGEAPSAIEFLDGNCLDLLRRESAVPLPEEARALLLLEVAGSRERVDALAGEMEARLRSEAPLELMRAADEADAQTVWAARYALSPLLKKLSPKRINEDVAVPVSQLASLIAGLEEIAQRSGLPIVNFGHAGNGNIHVNLLVDPENAATMEKVPAILEELFRLVVTLGGTLSGEHGVGTQKREFLPLEQDAATIALQRRLKTLFDPEGILNPGKLFPSG